MTCPCGAPSGNQQFCSTLCEKSQRRWHRVRFGTLKATRRGPIGVSCKWRPWLKSGGLRFPCQVKGCKRGEIGYRRCRKHMLELGGATAAIVLEKAA